MRRKQTKKRIATLLLVAYLISTVIFFIVIATPNSAIGLTRENIPSIPHQSSQVFQKIQALSSEPIVKTPPVEIIPKQLSQREIINNYVKEICAKYDNKIKPELVMSVIQTESEFNPKAKNGDSLGLMQISTRWHLDRAKQLGVKDFYDPYGNILLGVDYLVELTNQYKDTTLVLMLYNMKHDDAIKLYAAGKITTYAKTIIDRV